MYFGIRFDLSFEKVCRENLQIKIGVNETERFLSIIGSLDQLTPLYSYISYKMQIILEISNIKRWKCIIKIQL